MTVVNALSLNDYKEIFCLSEQDLALSIVDYQASFATFNAEMWQQQKRVVSCDHFYQNSLEWLTHYAEQHFSAIDFKHAQCMLNDFVEGTQEGRYVSNCTQLTDQQFDLAVCANYLFMVNPQDVDFQVKEISNLCRIASEARIFPLLDDKGKNSGILPAVMLQLQQQGYVLEVKDVGYQFQDYGHVMLRVKAAA